MWRSTAADDARVLLYPEWIKAKFSLVGGEVDLVTDACPLETFGGWKLRYDDCDIGGDVAVLFLYEEGWKSTNRLYTFAQANTINYTYPAECAL